MGHDDNNYGSIEVITGPMFAGKSEELLRRINRLIYAKKKFIVFKPTIDNRYSDVEIVSHQKRKYKAIPIDDSSKIYDYLTNDIQVVCVDEVQFFDEGIVEVCNNLAKRGIRSKTFALKNMRVTEKKGIFAEEFQKGPVWRKERPRRNII